MHGTISTCIHLRISIVVFLLSGVGLSHIYSQSHFYNSQQYGLRSTLLGGAVTSGDADLSMAYYNPGALHLAESRVAISLIKPEISNFGVGDYFGTGSQSTSLSVQLSPSLVSYNFIRGKAIHLSFITLQKSKWDYDISSKSSEQINDQLSDQIFEYRYKGSDNWYGFSSSYQINERFAIGLSQFISSSSFDYENVTSINRYDFRQNIQTAFFSRRLNTRQSISFSMVTKLGLHIQLERLNFGLVVKTPNYLRLLKGGHFTSERIQISPSNPTLESFAQFDLDPDTKTPWEFNAGASILLGRDTKLWLNVAHYLSVADHSLAEIANIKSEILDWRHDQKRLTNFSIGVSDQLTETVQVIGSFRTNFMAYDNQTPEASKQRLYILDTDRFHIALGTNLNINRSAITLGLDFAFANKSNDSLFEEYTNLGQIQTTPSDFINRQITLLLTYEFLLDRLMPKAKEVLIPIN